ncbi:Trafficking protein particle complex subunit 11 C-terminal domain-containing protein [Entamoeba marina]
MTSIENSLYPFVEWKNKEIVVDADSVNSTKLQITGSAPITIRCIKGEEISEKQFVVDEEIELKEVIQMWNYKHYEQFESDLLNEPNEKLIIAGIYELIILESQSTCFIQITPGAFDKTKSKIIEPQENCTRVVNEKMFVKYKAVDFHDNLLEFDELLCVITNDLTQATFELQLLKFSDCYGSPIPKFSQKGKYTITIVNKDNKNLIYHVSSFYLKPKEVVVENCIVCYKSTQKQVKSKMLMVVDKPIDLVIYLVDCYGNTIEEYDQKYPLSIRHNPQLQVQVNEENLIINATSVGLFTLDIGTRLQMNNSERKTFNGFPIEVQVINPINVIANKTLLSKKIPKSVNLGDLLSLSFLTFNSNDEESYPNYLEHIQVSPIVNNSIKLQSCIIKREAGFDVNIWITSSGILELTIQIDNQLIDGFPSTIEIQNDTFVRIGGLS